MFDVEKAIVCTEKMKDYFSSIAVDAEVEIPSNIEIKSTAHILYLFYSCLLDYGMRSKIYHANLISTYQKYVYLFDPNYVIEEYQNDPEKLLTILKNNIHPRYPNVALKKWLKLSEFLNNYYPGDRLKNKIGSFSSYKQLHQFIMNIDGYGQKTGGLLLRLLFESGICSFHDSLQDIPIDRHDVEISYLCGVVNRFNLTSNERKKLGWIWIQAANKSRISACDVDKYLWSIGNQLCSSKQCFCCPLKDVCQTKL